MTDATAAIRALVPTGLLPTVLANLDPAFPWEGQSVVAWADAVNHRRRLAADMIPAITAFDHVLEAAAVALQGPRWPPADGRAYQEAERSFLTACFHAWQKALDLQSVAMSVAEPES